MSTQALRTIAIFMAWHILACFPIHARAAEPVVRYKEDSFFVYAGGPQTSVSQRIDVVHIGNLHSRISRRLVDLRNLDQAGRDKLRDQATALKNRLRDDIHEDIFHVYTTKEIDDKLATHGQVRVGQFNEYNQKLQDLRDYTDQRVSQSNEFIKKEVASILEALSDSSKNELAEAFGELINTSVKSALAESSSKVETLERDIRELKEQIAELKSHLNGSSDR